MKHIIQQIAQELVEKIIKKAYSGKISDIDALTEDVLADCKASAARVVEAILAEMNHLRSLFTKLGMLHIARDYYYDKVMYAAWIRWSTYRHMSGSREA